MPDMGLQPDAVMSLPLQESPRPRDQRFPEYLKHADVLRASPHQLKLTAANGLFHAVLKGKVASTCKMLDRGTSINGRNDYGYSVLTAALHVDDDRRRSKLFRLLLDRGADPHFKDSGHGRSVLHWACVLARTEQAKALLEEVGGDLNLQERDNDSKTALHYAVMGGHLALVALLVHVHRKFGVSVDVADQLGLTPYLHAKRLGHREVASYLHSEGQASVGQGDVLFRTPREWSQIGKFERQRAVQVNTQEAINFAKIRGNVTRMRHLEVSMAAQRMGVVSNIGIPPPVNCAGRGPAVKAATDQGARLSQSLPSLHIDGPSGEERPFSANGKADQDAPDASVLPESPREAFSKRTEGHLASHPGTVQIQGVPSLHYLEPIGADGHGHVPVHRKGPGSIEAFALMEMNEKGRHAKSYRHSQFDKTKASEYKHMLGNLHSIMDVLSQQQSQSFRKSVKYQRPETPKKVKVKSKVSSLAVILGRDKRGKRGARAPRPPAKKGQRAGSSTSLSKDKGGDRGKPLPDKRMAKPLVKINDTPLS